MSRPLGSTATPASSGFGRLLPRAGPPASAATWYSVPPVSAVGRLPLATLDLTTPGRCFAARLLTFRARAADQAHAASTPDTTWPATRAPARLIPRGYQGPPVSMPSHAFRRLNSARPPRISQDRALLERLPGPHLTRSRRAFFPGRSPRQSSANAAPGRFDANPRRADAGGPTSLHLSHSIAYVRVFLRRSLLQRS